MKMQLLSCKDFARQPKLPISPEQRIFGGENELLAVRFTKREPYIFGTAFTFERGQAGLDENDNISEIRSFRDALFPSISSLMRRIAEFSKKRRLYLCLSTHVMEVKGRMVSIPPKQDLAFLYSDDNIDSLAEKK